MGLDLQKYVNALERMYQAKCGGRDGGRRVQVYQSRIKITQAIIFLFLQYIHMDTVDTLPHQISLLPTPTYTHIHLPRRSLSPAEEKAALIRKIQALAVENQTLEEKQSNLQGTIYDLRKLLAVVGRESTEEVEYLHGRNKVLKEKAQRLSKGLKYAYESGKHLNRCAQYWGEFLQQ